MLFCYTALNGLEITIVNILTDTRDVTLMEGKGKKGEREERKNGWAVNRTTVRQMSAIFSGLV